MNNLLHLYKPFDSKGNSNRPGPAELPKGAKVSSEKLFKLREDIATVISHWNEHTILKRPLISVKYIEVIAKSNRIQKVLSERGVDVSQQIVGAMFCPDDGSHIITYNVTRETLRQSVLLLNNCIKILDDFFDRIITEEDLEALHTNKKMPSSLISRSAFSQTIKDCHYVDALFIPRVQPSIKEGAIVSLYETGDNAQDLLKKIGIESNPIEQLDNNTFYLTSEEYDVLVDKASYLIAMTAQDISELVDIPSIEGRVEEIFIPEPTHEPIIGVLDTQFETDVYFKDWVEYKDMIDPSIPPDMPHCSHGTQVTSIIVDGPTLNPNLDDGCGRFRVKHFRVATNNGTSTRSILRSIEAAVKTNRDVKVWNLSLGTKLAIQANSISPEAEMLDRLQYKYDVIFVVAGTNNFSKTKQNSKIGSPADSINSLVINSVNQAGRPASYTRSGPVLSFFTKPDLSYYGGDSDEEVYAYSSSKKQKVIGTSIAAPWISRKLAYLIHVVGLSREIAKAILIDSASGWSLNPDSTFEIGHGIIPIHISDVIDSPRDEIKFYLSGDSEKYETYSFDIPVPIAKGKHPYIAKATLCYFPKCTRNQGVDYTDTEMDLHFGRIKGKGIQSINNNRQGNEGRLQLYERHMRRNFRKWDNVKLVGEILKERQSPRKVYENGLWGVSLKRKRRYGFGDLTPLKFGLVITLKAIDGVNRYDDFIQLCKSRQWIVNKIDVEQRVNVYEAAEQEIIFDDE